MKEPRRKALKKGNWFKGEMKEDWKSRTKHLVEKHFRRMDPGEETRTPPPTAQWYSSQVQREDC
jgi:hypothetical protein